MASHGVHNLADMLGGPTGMIQEYFAVCWIAAVDSQLDVGHVARDGSVLTEQLAVLCRQPENISAGQEGELR